MPVGTALGTPAAALSFAQRAVALICMRNAPPEGLAAVVVAVEVALASAGQDPTRDGAAGLALASS